MSFDHATLVPQEVNGVFDTINNYLSHFSDNKPDSIVLDTYEWAVMDICLRLASNNIAGLHTHALHPNETQSLVLLCKDDMCYCHHFAYGGGVFEIVRDISNYMDIVKNKPPGQMQIYTSARIQLKHRFDAFFGGKLDLDKNINLALKVIRFAGKEIYKADHELMLKLFD
jgi:hypothetical protein